MTTLLFLLFGSGLSFNLDLSTVRIFQGDQTNSHFGYSVALHQSEAYGNSVLTGAPLANTSAFLLYNIVNGGALYRCFVGK